MLTKKKKAQTNILYFKKTHNKIIYPIIINTLGLTNTHLFLWFYYSLKPDIYLTKKKET